ncbi:ankyrin [Massarina eburnea CBS 473.64]|uniref:Ankyrin n=1 Tax=Massarina eburnea CBS 473.64 TaxID=1395130 RepID=A0A6A6RHZ0_9PLEO|nr:ankyrin [Massarina eburnea CBS 473.64]
MTKDWDTMQAEIKDLSFVQKKRLDEVRKIMESRHGFKASTRAYRMKLAEWGFTKGRAKAGKDAKGRSARKRDKRQQREGGEDDGEENSDSTMGTSPHRRKEASNEDAARDNMPRDPENLETMLLGRATIQSGANDTDMVDPNLNMFQGSTDLLPASPFVPDRNHPIDPWSQGGTAAAGPVVDMLAAVLEGDSQKLEEIIMKHPNHLNLPTGLPFEVPGGRFYNHPAMHECVLLQHPDQTILDIACALPSGPVIWVLLSHNAKGSKHPYGTDLAFHNAIKNGRLYTVQALLIPGRSNIHGEAETSWKPFLQAVYWNQADVVRLLIDRGANVNDASPWVDGRLKGALQHCLERRAKDYLNKPVREKCEKILKMLLNAGADIHFPAVDRLPTTFQTFIEPWQGDPDWISKLSPVEIECLEAFVRKGANLKATFKGFICGGPLSSTFQHQVLWHTTPDIARLLIDHAAPSPEGNGSGLLHEIVGSCPDAKRHPSDTLRDINVLLKRGADPNLSDSSGLTPLRRCIERCPAVDIVPRLQMLLDNGADPELKHANRLPPYVLAARNFEDPLRSQLMDFLVAKIRGRQSRVVYDETFTWTGHYFPIADTPTWTQVQCYNGQNEDFNANLEKMVPEDVRKVFQRAAFSVASINFLNMVTAKAKANFPLSMSRSEKDEIYQAVQQRQLAHLPEYRFGQEFVLGLIKPQMAPDLANYDPNTTRAHSNDYLLPHETPILSFDPTALSASTTPTTLTTTRDSDDHPRRLSTSSNESSSFIVSTTQLRWLRVGNRTRHADIKNSKSAVLVNTCKECANGVMLTTAELERHCVEHEHCRECLDRGCTRRFCVVGRRGLEGLSTSGNGGSEVGERAFTFSPAGGEG